MALYRAWRRLARRLRVKVRQPARIEAELEGAGAAVTGREVLLASTPVGGKAVEVPSRICRMVATWR